MRAREPASFWRENVRDSCRYSTTECRECRSGGNKLSNDKSFIILRSGEGLTPFKENNVLTFILKKYNETFRGV